MQAIAVLQIALALLPLVQVAVPQFISWINALKAAAEQEGEWTEEQERAYRSALFAKTGDLAYGPDPINT